MRGQIRIEEGVGLVGNAVSSQNQVEVTSRLLILGDVVEFLSFEEQPLSLLINDQFLGHVNRVFETGLLGKDHSLFLQLYFLGEKLQNEPPVFGEEDLLVVLSDEHLVGTLNFQAIGLVVGRYVDGSSGQGNQCNYPHYLIKDYRYGLCLSLINSL